MIATDDVASFYTNYYLTSLIFVGTTKTSTTRLNSVVQRPSPPLLRVQPSIDEVVPYHSNINLRRQNNHSLVVKEMAVLFEGQNQTIGSKP